MSNTPNHFAVQEFFETLPVDREWAFALLQSEVPSQGVPSTRVQPYVESGEWDEGPSVPIKLLAENTCRGRIGTTNTRFCGAPSSECSIRSHDVSYWPGYISGWYIQSAVSLRAGFLQSPYLPSCRAGGPISQIASRDLQKPGDPVLLTVGQWCFIFNEWTLAQLEGSEQSTPSLSSSPPGSVIVEAPPQATSVPRHEPTQAHEVLHDELQLRVSRLESMLAHYSTKLAALESTNTVLHQQVDILATQANGPASDVLHLQHEVKQLKNVLSVGGGVKAHGVSFSHPNDIKSWILPLNNDVAIFHDLVSVLHCIGATTASHKSTLAMMKAQRDAKIGSDMEARVITSFF